MSFSHSSIKSYEACPLKYKLTRIDGLKEPSGDAAERGKRIHKELEDALNKEGILSEEIMHIQPAINILLAQNAKPEVAFGFTKDWTACAFDATDVWLRGVIDVFILDGKKAIVKDWKTGKERDYTDQVKLYATMVFATHPEVEEVELEFVYIDLKKTSKVGAIKRDEFAQLKKWVESRIEKIKNDTLFSPNPSFACKWCHFRKENGGPCSW